MRRVRKTLAVACLCLACLPCFAGEKRTDPLIQSTAEMVAFRLRVEDCIRRLQAEEPPDSDRLAAARQQYERAREAVHQYYLAALNAVENPQEKASATDAGLRATTAVSQLLNIIASEGSDRSLAAVVPPLLHLALALFDLPHKDKRTEKKLDAVARSLGWAPWEQIR